MLKKLSAALLLLVTLTYTILPVCAEPYMLRGDVRVTGSLTVEGATDTGSQVVQGAGAGAATNVYANSANNRTYTIPDAGGAASYVMTEGAQTINGVKTFGSPIAGASINNGTRRKVLTVPLVNGTIADSGVYTMTLPVMRACTVTAIKASIGTAIVGGTSTVAITKNGSTTLLSTATVDPTTFAANTATTLTLTGTGANLVFAAGDVIKFVHTAGTQTTDGVGEGFSVEVATDDF